MRHMRTRHWVSRLGTLTGIIGIVAVSTASAQTAASFAPEVEVGATVVHSLHGPPSVET